MKFSLLVTILALLLSGCRQIHKSIEWSSESCEGIPIRRCTGNVTEIKKSHVVALLISGTGTMGTSDSNGAKLIRFLAESLALSGIDSVWVLSREPEASFSQRAKDVTIVLNDLLSDGSGKKVVCIGHSEGCLVALKILPAEPRIVSLVAVSCPLLPGTEIALSQADAVLRRSDYDEKFRKSYSTYLAEAYRICADPSISLEEAGTMLAKLQERDLLSFGQYPKLTRESNLEKQRERLLTPRSRSFLASRPTSWLESSTQPLFLIYGGRDHVLNTQKNISQVTNTQNVRVKRIILPQLDHYMKMSDRFDTKVPLMIINFIKSKT